MRWVLSWKAVTDEVSGDVVCHKPKARLIIRAYHDPHILHLKRASPTLNTQNQNMVLRMAACHGWSCYVGDIKTASRLNLPAKSLRNPLREKATHASARSTRERGTPPFSGKRRGTPPDVRVIKDNRNFLRIFRASCYGCSLCNS